MFNEFLFFYFCVHLSALQEVAVEPCCNFTEVLLKFVVGDNRSCLCESLLGLCCCGDVV